MEILYCPNCGSTDYKKVEKHYTTRNAEQRTHLQAVCSECDSYIKNLPQLHKPQTYIPFGKYKGQHTYQIDDMEYMRWLHGVTDNVRLKLALEIRMRELNGGLL